MHTLNGSGVDPALLKIQAANRWPEILNRVGGLPAEILDGKHHPCPLCGGTDRFRLIDADAGAVLCSKCCTNCGDGIAAVQWALGVDFKEALRAIAGHLGIGPSNGEHVISDGEFVRRVCASKKFSAAAASIYGAEVAYRGRMRVLRFPMYGPDLQQCSEFDLDDQGGKGFSAKGKPVGLFLPHDDDEAPYVPKDVCFLAEGVKDAAASFEIGNPAVGLPTSTLNEKFAHLFQDRKIFAVPDLDDASFTGFEKTRRRLDGIANSFALVRIPGEMGSKTDLRDVLAKPNGRELVDASVGVAMSKLTQSPTSIEPVSIGQLIDDYPVLNEPVIETLLRRLEVMNLNAAPKVGKSWFSIYVMLCVATGRPIFGRYPVKRGKVLLVDLELHKSLIASRIKTVAFHMGISPTEYAGMIDVISLRGDWKSMKELLITAAAIGPDRYVLAIFDSKYRLNPDADENAAGDTTGLYNDVDRFAELTNTAVVVICHQTKGSQADKRITDTGSGSGAQSRAADCHAAIREHEDEGLFVFDAVVRSFAPFTPLVIKWEFPLWEADDWADPTKLKGLKSGTDERQTQRDKEGRDAIVNVLRGGAMTMNDLHPKASMGKDRAKKLLAQLESDGIVEHDTTTIAHNSAVVYRLTPESMEVG